MRYIALLMLVGLAPCWEAQETPLPRPPIKFYSELRAAPRKLKPRPRHRLTHTQEDECVRILRSSVSESLTITYNLNHAPPIFYYLWSISGVCAVICFVIGVCHLYVLHRAARTVQIETGSIFLPKMFGLYAKSIIFFPLMGILGCVSIFVPRYSLMFSLLLHLYEVACLIWFWEIMLDLMGGAENCVAELSLQAPSRVWYAPPLCFVGYFMAEEKFSNKHLIWSWNLVAQYAVVSTVHCLMAVISEISKQRFQYAAVVSLLFCMWGIFAFYKVSAPLRSSFNLGWKFACLKLVVFAIRGVEIICKFETVVGSVNTMYNNYVMAQVWTSFVPAILALPFTILAYRAFPPHDLRNRHLNPTLKQHFQRDISLVPTDVCELKQKTLPPADEGETKVCLEMGCSPENRTPKE